VSIQFGSTEQFQREYDLFDDFSSPILTDSLLKVTELDQDNPFQGSAPDTDAVNESANVVQPDDDDPFCLNELIDDMSYRVWKCGRCLSMRHLTASCTNNVRCRSCFRYGHMRKDCLGGKRFGCQNGN
jgi:hypothetical protein